MMLKYRKNMGKNGTTQVIAKEKSVEKQEEEKKEIP